MRDTISQDFTDTDCQIYLLPKLFFLEGITVISWNQVEQHRDDNGSGQQQKSHRRDVVASGLSMTHFQKCGTCHLQWYPRGKRLPKALCIKKMHCHEWT